MVGVEAYGQWLTTGHGQGRSFAHITPSGRSMAIDLPTGCPRQWGKPGWNRHRGP